MQEKQNGARNGRNIAGDVEKRYGREGERVMRSVTGGHGVPRENTGE